MRVSAAPTSGVWTTRSPTKPTKSPQKQAERRRTDTSQQTQERVSGAVSSTGSVNVQNHQQPDLSDVGSFRYDPASGGASSIMEKPEGGRLADAQGQATTSGNPGSTQRSALCDHK